MTYNINMNKCYKVIFYDESFIMIKFINDTYYGDDYYKCYYIDKDSYYMEDTKCILYVSNHRDDCFRRDLVGSSLPDASVGMRDLEGEESSRLEDVIVKIISKRSSPYGKADTTEDNIGVKELIELDSNKYQDYFDEVLCNREYRILKERDEEAERLAELEKEYTENY